MKDRTMTIRTTDDTIAKFNYIVEKMHTTKAQFLEDSINAQYNFLTQNEEITKSFEELQRLADLLSKKAIARDNSKIIPVRATEEKTQGTN